METIRVKDDGGLTAELLKASKSETLEAFLKRKNDLLKGEPLFAEREALLVLSAKASISVHLYEKRPLMEWYGRIYINMKSVNLEWL